MATQSQIFDEIYAQRSAEFISRQRIANEQYAERQAKEQAKRNKALRVLITNANEKQRKIRLHHPSTRRQIGEAVKVHYKSDSILMFELINHPGKMLRVNTVGKVEFAPVQDDTAVFELEAMYSGNLYFLCTAYRDRDNTLGGKGWYLSMTPQGQLQGNGGKCEAAQWLLLEEAPPQPNGIVGADGRTSPVPSGSNSGTAASNSTLASQTNPIYERADGAAAVVNRSSTKSGFGVYNAGADGSFPGLGAGREALMRYFLTQSGTKFLMQPEYAAAYALYLNNGTLSKILHRPDWPLVANRFVDYIANPLPALRKATVDAHLSYAQLRSYFEHGYVVGRGLVSPELCGAALKMVNFWTSRFLSSTRDHADGSNTTSTTTSTGSAAVAGEGVRRGSDGLRRGPLNTAVLTGTVCSDVDILALFYATPAVHVVQRLLGAGDVAHPLSCTIITTFPTLELVDAPALFGDQWTIDGFTSAGGHSPFTLLVGVALTDIPEGNCGNFCVHPGSHMSLLEEFQAQVQRRSTLFSEDPKSVKKPDLGEPTQLIMRAGDVFFCSQRTAYLHTLNASATPTTIVYFKISHLDHAVLKNSALESLWVEYKSAAYYLESSDEAAAEAAAAALEARRSRQQQQSQATPVRKESSAPLPVAVPVPFPSAGAAQSQQSQTSGVKGTPPPKPSSATKSVAQGSAKNTASTTTTTPAGAEKKPVITPKQSAILRDLLVSGRDPALWEDTPVVKKSGGTSTTATSSSATASPAPPPKPQKPAAATPSSTTTAAARAGASPTPTCSTTATAAKSAEHTDALAAAGPVSMASEHTDEGPHAAATKGAQSEVPPEVAALPLPPTAPVILPSATVAEQSTIAATADAGEVIEGVTML